MVLDCIPVTMVTARASAVAAPAAREATKAKA